MKVAVGGGGSTSTYRPATYTVTPIRSGLTVGGGAAISTSCCHLHLLLPPPHTGRPVPPPPIGRPVPVAAVGEATVKVLRLGSTLIFIIIENSDVALSQSVVIRWNLFLQVFSAGAD